jgi:soluble lytic murein transglycosylase-like protein
MKNKYLAKIALAGILNIAGGLYSSNIPHEANNQDKLNKKIEYLNSEEYKREVKNQERIDSIMNYPKISKTEVDKLIKEKHSKLKPKYADTDFIKSIMKYESGYNQFATSHVGAKGLMQVMNDNYIKPNKKELSDTIELYIPEINVEEGIKILKGIERFCENENPFWNELQKDEKQKVILASYNWGIGKMKGKNWDMSRIPTKTKEYIDNVMKDYQN